MRCYLVAIVGAFAALHYVIAEPPVFRISVLADTDKTEGGELATIIANDLRRSKDIVIDEKSPDLTVHVSPSTYVEPVLTVPTSRRLLR
jgi:hypothetical protein